MERKLARYIAATTVRSSSNISAMIPLIRAHSSSHEYEHYSKAIASIVAEASLQILNKIFEEHPDLKVELDQEIQSYGVIL